MADRNHIEDAAASLLLKQKIRGEFSLSLLDYKRINLCGIAEIMSFDMYKKITGTSLPENIEGCTVKYGGNTVILINDFQRIAERINWTIAHEIGHTVLGHRSCDKREEREANLFAASLLMPEAVIRYLDARENRKISPDEMKKWFAASITACKKRREEIDRKEPYNSSQSDKLVDLIFRI